MSRARFLVAVSSKTLSKGFEAIYIVLSGGQLEGKQYGVSSYVSALWFYMRDLQAVAKPCNDLCILL